MSKVSISGDQNGTGDFTIKAPNSNTDRTLTIPDSDGEFLFTDSSGDLSVDGDISAPNLTGLSSVNSLGPISFGSGAESVIANLVSDSTGKITFGSGERDDIELPSSNSSGVTFFKIPPEGNSLKYTVRAVSDLGWDGSSSNTIRFQLSRSTTGIGRAFVHYRDGSLRLTMAEVMFHLDYGARGSKVVSDFQTGLGTITTSTSGTSLFIDIPISGSNNPNVSRAFLFVFGASLDSVSASLV